MLSYLSLLLAVTTVQATPTPAPQARPHRRPRAALAPIVAAVPALEAGAAALVAAQPDIEALTVQAPVLAMAASDLQMAAYSLAVAPVAFAAPVFYWDGDDDEDVSEPRWQDQAQADVADSLYRAARQALNRSQYTRAAELFSSIRDKYPRSTYVPNTPLRSIGMDRKKRCALRARRCRHRRPNSPRRPRAGTPKRCCAVCRVDWRGSATPMPPRT